MSEIIMPDCVQNLNVPINAWHEEITIDYINEELKEIERQGGKENYLKTFIYKGNIFEGIGEPQKWLWNDFISLRRESIKSILEVGCGRGTMAIWWHSRGFNYIGIDVSLASIGYCESLKTSYRHNGMIFRQMLAEDLKFPDNHFDLIYSQHTLEHTHNLDKAFSEQFRIGKYIAGILPIPQEDETAQHLQKIQKADIEKYLKQYASKWQIQTFEVEKANAYWAEKKEK